MSLHKVSSKGQVTLPVECRRALGVRPHDRVAIQLEEDRIVIRPVPDFIELEGFLGPRLSEAEERTARESAVSARVEGKK